MSIETTLLQPPLPTQEFKSLQAEALRGEIIAQRFDRLFSQFQDLDIPYHDIHTIDYRLADSTLNRAVVAYMNIDDNDVNLSEEALIIRKENTDGTLSKQFLYIMREGTRDEKKQLSHEQIQFFLANTEEEIRIPEGNKLLKVDEWGELVEQLLDVDMNCVKKINSQEALTFIRGINFSDATSI